MRLWNVWGCLALAGAILCGAASGQNQPTAPGAGVTKDEKTLARKVTTKPTTKPVKDQGPKLLVPVNKIKTLSEEQLVKLREIAAQAEKDKEAIMEKAREASFAVLTAEQKGELEQFKQKAQAAAAERKAKAAKQREERQKAREEKAKLKGQKKGKPGEAGAATAKP